MKSVAVVWLVVIITVGGSFFAGAYVVSQFRPQNDVCSVGFKEGTLLAGTTAGLLVYRDGVMRRFVREDGLPSDYVRNAVPVDAWTFYIGPFGPVQGPQRLYEARLVQGQLVLRDVTPPGGFHGLADVLAVGPDGSLWAGDKRGLHRYDGTSWVSYDYPEEMVRADGSIAFGADGSVWVASWYGFAYVLDGGWRMQSSGPPGVTAYGASEDGVVWATAGTGLYKLTDRGWELVSDDELWTSGVLAPPSRIIFDGEGKLWAMAPDCLRVYDGQRSVLVTEADGFEFRKISLRGIPCLSSCALVPPNTVLFGLWGYGLLFETDGQFRRVYVQDCLPGGYVSDVCEDGLGRLWARSLDVSVLGVFAAGCWRQIDAAWLWSEIGLLRQGAPQLAVDVDGSVWVRSGDGAVVFTESGQSRYDEANSALASGGYVAVDALGTKWFTNPDPSVSQSDGAAVRFDGERWRRYASTGYFESEVPRDLTIGPGDTKWFHRWAGGYTVFDGQSWSQLRFGEEIPHPGRVFFDLDGNAYLASRPSTEPGAPGPALYAWEGGLWEAILDASVNDLQSDADGVLWCASYEGVFTRRDGRWRKEPWSDEVCAPQDDVSAPSPGAIRLLIDHNGDKWVGTKHGLNRIKDGGAAQQKLELLVEDSGGYVTLTGRFVNAGAVIPVLLWLGCECDGRIFYYPDWSTTPTPVKMVLGAYSVEEKELLRLDKSSLPPGDYTFIGGISLLGGIDLLIGPRDSKLCLATYRRE